MCAFFSNAPAHRRDTINLRRTPRWNVACNEGEGDHQQRNEREDRRIGRAHVQEQNLHNARQGERGSQSQRRAGERQSQSPPDHYPRHVCALRAQGHSNADIWPISRRTFSTTSFRLSAELWLFAVSLAPILIRKRRKNPSSLSLSSSNLSLSCLSFSNRRF